jgi:hypothetical protein
MKVLSSLSIEFAGVTLPVVKSTEGEDVVPLKPICDGIGLSWNDVHKKTQSEYLARRLGICMGDIPHAGQVRNMVCLRLDRVVVFLNSINPDNVRVGGNHTAADFLEEKHAEWDAVLHEYESRQGGMLAEAVSAGRLKSVNLRLFLSVLKEKRSTQDASDRAALSLVAKDLAGEIGIPYQSELIP